MEKIIIIFFFLRVPVPTVCAIYDKERDKATNIWYKKHTVQYELCACAYPLKLYGKVGYALDGNTLF